MSSETMNVMRSNFHVFTDPCAARHSGGTAWPRLQDLGISAGDREARRGGVGGSDANTIFSGDPERIIKLWQEKREGQAIADLSGVLPVMLGNWTEEFNRQWYEMTSGNTVSHVGFRSVSDRHDWRRCTLDGFIESSSSIWEAKHTSAFTRSEEVVERYMPQLQHNMAVMGSERAVLSVIFGNQKFEIFEIAADWFYQLELLEAEQNFWDCVQSGTLPVAVSPPSPPRPVGVREINFEGNNAWASAAVTWLETKRPAKEHTASTDTIKKLVDYDVCRAFGHGIEAKRSKSGALTIREHQS